MSTENQAAAAYNAGASTGKGVRTLAPGYDIFLDKWTRCRDVIAGGDAVKAKNDKYLPKLNNQQANDYLAYKTRANFFNATGRTVDAMLGMLFRKDPKLEVSASIEEYLNDVTMEGESFEVFSREVSEEVISVGRVGLLVDHPPSVDTQGAPLTVAAAQTLGLRPTIKLYVAENILNWRYRVINNANMLAMVVLKELYSEPDGEFNNKTEDRYRVLDLNPETNTYRMRVFRINNKGEDEQVGADIIPLMNNKPLTYIPFVFVCPDGTDADFDQPPILDLVDLNLSHYRSSADYEHGCHFTALPMLYVAGMSQINVDGTQAQIYLGSQSALILPNADAKAGFIEFTGGGLTTLENNLNRKEQMMAVLGARMLEAQKKAAETATTSAIHRTGENSILASISIAVSTALKQSLIWFSQWAGVDASDKTLDFEINKDFLPVAIDGPTLTAYVGAFQAGALTGEELFDLMQRADLIEAEVTYDEHQANIDTQSITLPPAAAALLNKTGAKPGGVKPAPAPNAGLK